MNPAQNQPPLDDLLADPDRQDMLAELERAGLDIRHGWDAAAVDVLLRLADRLLGKPQ